MIAQLWKLPPEIQNVLAHHHSFPAGEAPSRLSAAVAMVEELSRDLGHGVEIGPGHCDRVAPENLARAREVLGFTDEQEAELRETAKILAASVAKDFTLGEQEPPPAPATQTAASAAAAKPPAAARPAAPQQARLSLWRRLRRWFRRSSSTSR
jgi:hypothetical protein